MGVLTDPYLRVGYSNVAQKLDRFCDCIFLGDRLVPHNDLRELVPDRVYRIECRRRILRYVGDFFTSDVLHLRFG